MRIGKPLVFILALAPCLWGLWLGFSGQLGANPIKTSIHYTGIWTLRFLIIALAVSPLSRLTGWTQIMRYRRMLGLFAFFYAACHLLLYVGVDQFFAFGDIWADIVKRPFISVGMAAFVILLSLALTSPRFMVRLIGGRRWRLLHRSVYVAAVLAVIHYYMGVRADLSAPLIYAGIMTILLVLRIPLFLRFRFRQGEVRS